MQFHEMTTNQVNKMVSNWKHPKNFGFSALHIAATIAKQLGIKGGPETKKPIWEIARKAIESAEPCTCEDRCYCSSCIIHGCPECFHKIAEYTKNIFQKGDPKCPPSENTNSLST